MATYAISDIHGAYEELVKLLHRIDFHLDGSDTLYLLGDFIDWGEKSMETLLYVKELDERYDFVHCVMGNHELMFLETIDSGYHGRDLNEVADNWLYKNHGVVTWNAFAGLPLGRRLEIVSWLRNLRLSFTCEVGGLHFMLAHAYPYYYDVPCSEKEALRMRQDAVWRRLFLNENPFATYTGKEHYDYLICGHTVSDTYYQQLRTEKGWHSSAPYVRNRIFRGENFIDIDCGAKCMDLPIDASPAWQIASMKAQLGCLRLDDMEGIYVHRPAMQVPNMDIEEMREEAIESLRLEIHLPDMRVPEFRVPEFAELRKFKLGQLQTSFFQGRKEGSPEEDGSTDYFDE